MTKDVLTKIPMLHEREDNPDPLVVCKFFMPYGAWTWYVIEGATHERDGCGMNCTHKPLSEYDPERHDVLFFGYVKGFYPELGYFTLRELEAIRGQFGLPVERDRFFTPCKLSEIR